MKLRVFAFLLFILSGCLLNAQSWVADGANWYYDFYSNPYVNYTNGYAHMYKAGETVSNGHTCDILVVDIYDSSYLAHSYGLIYHLANLTYSEGNIIYYAWDNGNNFRILYDFNVQAGDTMTCQWTPISNRVDSVGQWIVSGVPLKVFYFPYFSSDFSFPVLERIGCLGFMPPIPLSSSTSHSFDHGRLRCYYDNSGLYYSSGIRPACDFITPAESEELDITQDFYLGTITVQSAAVQPGTIARVYNMTGQLVAETTASEKGYLLILLPEYATGIYFVQITGNQKPLTKKFLLL